MRSIGRKKKLVYWTNLNLFFILTKMNSIETYGDFRVEFLHDGSREKLRENSLFLNLYDLWCLRRNGFLLQTYKLKLILLKKLIKRRLRGRNDLPGFKVILFKFKEGDGWFDPMLYLNGDEEEFFNKLIVWKRSFEEDLLQCCPSLREEKRHKKIYINPCFVRLYR